MTAEDLKGRKAGPEGVGKPLVLTGLVAKIMEARALLEGDEKKLREDMDELGGQAFDWSSQNGTRGVPHEGYTVPAEAICSGVWVESSGKERNVMYVEGKSRAYPDYGNSRKDELSIESNGTEITIFYTVLRSKDGSNDKFGVTTVIGFRNELGRVNLSRGGYRVEIQTSISDVTKIPNVIAYGQSELTALQTSVLKTSPEPTV